MSESAILDRAVKAQAVLDSDIYKQAYEDCRAAIIVQIDACPLKDVEQAENLRKCLRLLRDVRANMLEALNAGKLPTWRIEQEQQARKNPFRGLFR